MVPLLIKRMNKRNSGFLKFLEVPCCAQFDLVCIGKGRARGDGGPGTGDAISIASEIAMAKHKQIMEHCL